MYIWQTKYLKAPKCKIVKCRVQYCSVLKLLSASGGFVLDPLTRGFARLPLGPKGGIAPYTPTRLALLRSPWPHRGHDSRLYSPKQYIPAPPLPPSNTRLLGPICTTSRSVQPFLYSSPVCPTRRNTDHACCVACAAPVAIGRAQSVCVQAMQPKNKISTGLGPIQVCTHANSLQWLSNMTLFNSQPHIV